MPTLLSRLARACLATLAALLVLSAPALADRPFSSAYSANVNGNITIAANTLETCPTVQSGCTGAQNAPVGNTAANDSYENDSYSETYVNVSPGGAPAGTGVFDSSSAALRIPTGATVLFAGLYWDGSIASTLPSSYSNVLLKLPGASAYTPVTATRPLDTTTVTSGQSFYQGFANVTSTVAAAGAGAYTVGNVGAATGATAVAGWSLVVAYSDPSQPLRNLDVYDGLLGVNQNATVNVDVNGFLTPLSGAVNTKLGFVAYEGDRGIVGDTAAIADVTHAPTAFHTLSDAANPATNFFNSSISDSGAEVTSRNPAYSNTLGLDADLVSANNLLGNGATSARIRLSTSGDIYAPGVVTFATDLYSPAVSQTKTVTDVNGGNVEEGDLLTYDVTGRNTGGDPARNLTITDPVPGNTTYVPGSATVITSDATSAGTATYAGAGNGTASFTFPTVAANGTYHARFQVRVNSPLIDGTEIDNTATTTYTGATLGLPGTVTSSASSTVSAPDLSITKSHEGDLSPGSDVTYTLDVANHGSAATQGAFTVTDTPDADLTPVSLAGDGYDCDLASLSCTSTAPLAAGAHATITLVAHLDPDALGPVSNQASVSGGGDGDPLDNGTVDAGVSAPAADLALTKTASQLTAVVGDSFTYSLLVQNLGPARSRDVVVSDPVPDGLEVTSADPECTIAGQLVTCDVDSIAAGGDHTFHITVRATSASAGTDPDNVATVASTLTADPDQTNNRSDAVVHVGATDLEVHKQLLTDDPTVGGPVRYRVTVTNHGPSAATGVTATDVITGAHDPAGSVDGGASCTATGATVLSCPIGTLAAGATATITVDATLDGDATTVTNTASATGVENDSDPTNNSDTVTAPVAGTADLSLTKRADAPTVEAGGIISYTLTAANGGPGVAFAARAVDPLPAGTTFVDGDAGCAVDAGVVTCDFGDLASEDTATRTFRVQVAPAATAPTTVHNSATVTSSTPDANLADNTGTADVGVRGADLSLGKTPDSTAVDQGGTITYTLAAHNAGPGIARNAVITDQVPAGTTFASASGCAESAGTVTCPLGDLGSGADATRTVTVTVGDDTTGTITNAATVTSDTRDDDQSDNLASATVTVRGADVGITKTADASSVDQGGTITYTLAVHNAGPGRARNVTVTDVLPAGASFASASSDCANAAGTVTCSIGALASGADATRTITVRVGADAPGTLRNTATVSSPTPDPDTTNNASSTDVGVRSADLSVVKTADAAAVDPGGTITYTLAVHNAGPSGAAGVTVTDPLPAGTTFASASSGCANAGGIVTCSFGSVAAGADAAATVRVAVGASTTGVVHNTATVSSGTRDPDAGNDASSADVTVRDKSDLAIVKTASTHDAAPGDVITYTLKVTDNGPRSASGVVVSDPLPADVTFVSATPGAPTCVSASNVVTCRLGSLASGASATVLVKAKVNAIAVPSASDTHTLRTGTVEAKTDVSAGQTKTLSVACPSGYDVTDASARLDDLTDVTGSKLVEVRSLTQTADGSYQATVRNGTTTKSTVRLEGFCLSHSTTSTRGHTHDVVITPAIGQTAVVPAGARQDVTVECGPGQTAVAPSYSLSGAGSSRIAASAPTDTGWRFTIESGSTATTASVSVRCLDPLTTESAGHLHRLGLEHKTVQVRVGGYQYATPRVTCDDGSSAIVGSHDLPTGVVTLGNDPDVAGRTFRVLNTTTSAKTVTVDATCLDYKTGSPAVIRTASNTATVSAATPDPDASDNSSTADVTITAGDAPAPAKGCDWWRWWVWWHHSGWNHH
jgi:uncharacterized repeat protein (TIGR01451 family)